jgi:hypothetical protein
VLGLKRLDKPFKMIFFELKKQDRAGGVTQQECIGLAYTRTWVQSLTSRKK